MEIQNEEFTVQKPKFEIEHLVRFCLKPHRNGRDWIAEPNELHHGGWWTELRQALDYALYRGNGRVCTVETQNAEGGIMKVVLVDRRGEDSCPTQNEKG